MSSSNKPVIVLSRCLAGENVRYDGTNAYDPFVEKLLKYVDIIPVCPEVEIGLPVPRPKIIVVKENRYKVYQPETRRDLTKPLKDFSYKFLDNLPQVDGFLLKSKSPSCGFSGTKTYKTPEGKGYIGRRKGLFAIAVKEKFPYHPAADELMLKDFYKKYIFLTKLYLFFNYRAMETQQFVKNFEEILKLFSKKQTEKFKKNPSYQNFLKIFSRKIGQKWLNNKIPDFKQKILNDPVYKKYIIFPEEFIRE